MTLKSEVGFDGSTGQSFYTQTTTEMYIKDFVDHQLSPLTLYIEQAVEAAHQDFHHQWQKFNQISTHLEYARRLSSYVIDYNSKHL